jgi:hypothetical protein
MAAHFTYIQVAGNACIEAARPIRHDVNKVSFRASPGEQIPRAKMVLGMTPSPVRTAR